MKKVSQYCALMLGAFAGSALADSSSSPYFTRNAFESISSRDRYQFNLDDLPGYHPYSHAMSRPALSSHMHIEEDATRINGQPELPHYLSKDLYGLDLVEHDRVQAQKLALARQWKTEEPPHVTTPLYDKPVEQYGSLSRMDLIEEPMETMQGVPDGYEPPVHHSVLDLPLVMPTTVQHDNMR